MSSIKMDVEPPMSLHAPLHIPPKTMTGPGPSNVHPRVLKACTLPMIGISFLHQESNTLVTDIIKGIQYTFQTKNRITLCISATAHGGMEAICWNLLEAGDRVLACINGLWGERFSIICDKQDLNVTRLVKPFGQVFGLDEVEQALKAVKPRLMFITYGESVGGTMQPLEGLGQLCHRFDCLLVVDGVATVGGAPMFMDRWGIDVLYTGTQKALSAPPGLTPISFSDRSWERVLNRKTKIRSYLFDLTHLVNVWGCDGLAPPPRYHHTPSLTNMYALREALALICEEGLENCWARHKRCTELLHEGVARLGLKLVVKDPRFRLPTVSTIEVPADVDWKQVSRYAMDKYKVEIAGGLAESDGRIWRIGLMGYNANPDTAKLVLKALEEGLQNARHGKIVSQL